MLFCWKIFLLNCTIVFLRCGIIHSVPVVWNATLENWMEFYKRYCGRVCKGRVIKHVSSFDCQTPSCFKCDCDPNCIIYGTCCPPFDSNIDMDINNRSSLNDSETFPARKLPSQDRFFCSAFPGSDNYMYVITDCSPDYLHMAKQGQTNASLKLVDSDIETEDSLSVSERCVHSKTDTFDDVTPYIDLQYGITFKNAFCAMCNGYVIDKKINKLINYSNSIKGSRQVTVVEDSTTPVVGTVSAWTLSVSCHHYQQLFHITSELELFRSALELGREQCDVAYTQPKITARAKQCDPKFHRVTQATCSSSRSSLQGHCLGLKYKFLRVSGGPTIFCHMCNDGLLSASDCNKWTPLGSGIFYDSKIFTRPHLSLLLGASRLESHVTDGVDVSCKHSSEWRSVGVNINVALA
ncbi:unnamed protein product [Candidula unifasciata]|uniref:SMB domain-containing protein n=1 Tax=Candidula unifasciata TaxID=100452 RepID=A0A8S3ZYW2_9EUPU|nr:unnamed protein product [Candidula unifasciata]